MTPEIPRFVDKPFRVRKDGRTLLEQYETQTSARSVARAYKKMGAKVAVVNVKTSEVWDV